jgi:thiol-disulfide isomerase/thioredoxin
MMLMLVVTLIGALSLPAQAISVHSDSVRPAPSLVVPIATGGVADLSQLRGRVVLVNFWASWCPPCLMEMPSMNRLARTMGRSPFIVLAVNTDESLNWLQAYIHQTQPSFPIGLDEGGQNLHAWGGTMVPASFLVDKLGRIRYSLVGPMDWDSSEMVGLISNLISEPMPSENAPAWQWWFMRR